MKKKKKRGKNIFSLRYCIAMLCEIYTNPRRNETRRTEQVTTRHGSFAIFPRNVHGEFPTKKKKKKLCQSRARVGEFYDRNTCVYTHGKVCYAGSAGKTRKRIFFGACAN